MCTQNVPYLNICNTAFSMFFVSMKNRDGDNISKEHFATVSCRQFQTLRDC